MSDQPDTVKSPLEAVVEHAVEAFVYAPIGLLFDGASLLPQLVEKGRSQVTMARMLGQFAVTQGREEATKAATKLQDQAAGMLELLAGAAAPLPTDDAVVAPAQRARKAARPGSKKPGAARDAARRAAGVAPGAPAAPKAKPPTASASRASSTAPAPASTAAPAVASLAIPDYDGLSASHVVNRLAGLTATELEAVRSYEAAHRGRKTILSKVAQLQSA